MAHPMKFAEDYLDFDRAEAEAEAKSALPSPDDKDVLTVMIEGLEIFRDSQAWFSQPFWAELCQFLAGDDPVDCTWNQIDAFYERLKGFAKQVNCELKGVNQ
jgi:hypothetical protein